MRGAGRQDERGSCPFRCTEGQPPSGVACRPVEPFQQFPCMCSTQIALLVGSDTLSAPAPMRIFLQGQGRFECPTRRLGLCARRAARLGAAIATQVHAIQVVVKASFKGCLLGWEVAVALRELGGVKLESSSESAKRRWTSALDLGVGFGVVVQRGLANRQSGLLANLGPQIRLLPHPRASTATPCPCCVHR